MAKMSRMERLKLVEEAQKIKEPEPSLSSLSDDENVESLYQTTCSHSPNNQLAITECGNIVSEVAEQLQ